MEGKLIIRFIYILYLIQYGVRVYFFFQGTQIKSVEDDPSMTPGSVARSPLSLATIKDTEILSSSSKSSPPDTSTVTMHTIPPLSLSSSPWTFNPTSSSVYTR